MALRPATVVIIVWRFLLWPVRAIAAALARRHPARYVLLRLPAQLPALTPQMRFWERWRAKRTPAYVSSLAVAERLLRHVGEDSRMHGVVFYAMPARSSWHTLGALRRAVLRLRRLGKEVVVYLPKGGGERDLYWAAAADRLFISPGASLDLLGSSTQQFYLADLLQRLGVAVQVSAQGDFKTAAENLTHGEMSPNQRLQLQVLLDQRQAQLCEAFAQRLVPGVRGDDLFTESKLVPARAQALGLVSDVLYEDGLPAALGEQALGSRWCRSVGSYGAVRLRPPWRALPSQRHLAQIELRGAIREQSGRLPGRFITLDASVATLRRLAQDADTAGVLLYIDSPGGSALVSDLIHHEIERLASVKPVVAFFGSVAASGGYYVAAPASWIVAAPESITGSIGVVSVSVVLGELLAKAHVRPQVVRAAPHADMLSGLRPLSEDELRIIDSEGQRIYQRFIDVVSQGRGLEEEQVRAHAGGRVWTAQDALERSLVDQLGDLDVALGALRERVGAELPVRRVWVTGQPRVARPPEASKPRPSGALAQAYATLVGGDECGFGEGDMPGGRMTALFRDIDVCAWLLDSNERVVCYVPELESLR